MVHSNLLTLKLQSRNYKKYGLDMNAVVSVLSALIVILFITYVVMYPSHADVFLNSLKISIIRYFNWWFVLVINLTILFVVYLMVSKYRHIVIGGKHHQKEFSNFTWYAMLFSAGIGIGIYFYGIYEPIVHVSIPVALQSNPVVDSFKIMYLHWGFHAWAVYAIVAISIAYFSFNCGLPLSIRSIFYPLFKEKIFGILGDIIDAIAVVSVLFGLSTSLGLGAQQINSGLNYIWNVPISTTVQLILIVLITFIATLSVVSGVRKGIKLLSELNVKVSFILLLTILLVGPTLMIFQTFFVSLKTYIIDFLPMSTFVAKSNSDVIWQSGWTIFFWAWWFSWSPFIGVFIARISKGRSIKEMAIGVMILPSLVCFFTMTILGRTGIEVDTVTNGALSTGIEENIANSLFIVLDYLFDSMILSKLFAFIAMIVIVLFFVTSSDSGSLIVDYLTSSGKIKTPKKQRIFWAVLEGAIAASVLVLGGLKAISTLQTIVIIMGLPFSFMLVLMMLSFIKALKADQRDLQTKNNNSMT